MIPIDEVLQQSLNAEQYDAATDINNRVLTLACAGSGKSRTLAFRIARLISEGADPRSIVAFTFTEKAAESIKRRVAQALDAAGIPPTVLGAMYIGTIHSYCHLILGEIDARYRQFEVLDSNGLILYLMSRYGSLGLADLRATRNNPRYFDMIREVTNAWTTVNDEVASISDVRVGDQHLEATLLSLDQRLRQDHYIDFSLMVRSVVEALERDTPGARTAISHLKHLTVDEYQDVNPSQERLIQAMFDVAQSNFPEEASLFVVGDDDQAIYAWRGADVSNILTFSSRYPTASVHRLSTNFRSIPPIVESADDFIGQELGARRIPKNPTAIDRQGSRDFRVLWFSQQSEEAEWIAQRIEALIGTEYNEYNPDGTIRETRGLTPADFAILMRSVGQNQYADTPRHRLFTEALRQHNIPYTLKAAGGIFERPQVEALRQTFVLLRSGSPDRPTVQQHFSTIVQPAYPHADFTVLTEVLSDWGRRIHMPAGGARQRLYPQKLVYDLLNAFGLQRNSVAPEVMQEIGVFSRMILDAERVYVSVDSARRFGDILNFLENAAEHGYDISTDDVLNRPDAVTISTVHGVKGLEFPVVLIADVRRRRFPRDRSNYHGWLPNQVIQRALNRGAYQSTLQEEARLFYTALTRAERYLYVSGSERVPGTTGAGSQSSFALRLRHPTISNSTAGLPSGIVPHEQVRRFEDISMPTNFSDVKYYLRCPKEYQYRRRFGFSPAVPDLFGFGMTVHTSIGRLHQVCDARTPSLDEVEQIVEDTFHLKHVYQSTTGRGPYENARDAAKRIVRRYVQEYSGDFARERQVEVRFEILVSNAVISGSIDLLLKEDDAGTILEARIIDFKAMEGGEDAVENEALDWRELALQVQLYAKAAREVIGENARTGAVHLLKDNQRVEVPVDDLAVDAAVANVEWAVQQIVAGDFPMRPHALKCPNCDFRMICEQRPEHFQTEAVPPPIHTPQPKGEQMARAFAEFDEDYRNSDA